MRSVYRAALIAAAAFSFAPAPASAIPVFAHRYGLSCQACHTEVPHLTSFGEQFLANGYRIKGLKAKGAFPAAVRIEADYASAGSADPDDVAGPLPKTIVNEVEVLVGGSVGPRGSYWAEPYLIDGGFIGKTRDFWYAYRTTNDGATTPITVRAGQFTLPLPLDPETFRETTQPYLIWSQTAGANPFNFFNDKIGAQVEFGDPARAVSGTVAALNAHDVQSGLPTDGVDTMETLQRDFGDYTFKAYRYDGSRSLSGLAYGGNFQINDVPDRFWRNGYSAGYHHGNTEIDAVYQTGHDSAADLYHDALITSGGFLQARQELGHGTFAIARWDATQDTVFNRAITAGLGHRLSRNTRLEVFGTVQRNYLGELQHILSSSFLVAY